MDQQDCPRIVIVGAGLTGLALAFRARHLLPRAVIHLLEQRDRPGGNIWTEYREGFRVEAGPNGFLDSKPTTLHLCRNLDLGSRLIAGSEGSRKNRYVFWNGKLQALPGSLWGFATSRLLSVKGKFNVLWEKYRKRPRDLNRDESVAEFVRRRAGNEAAELFADAMVTGIHGGDPEQLSMKAAFPRVTQFERDHGSVMRGMTHASRVRRRKAEARGEPYSPPQMWSFRMGLRTMVERLHDEIGGSLRLRARIRKVEYVESSRHWEVYGEGQERWRADHLVLACPAYEQAALLGDLDPVLSEELSAIRYNRIAVVALGFERSDCPGDLDGFGYIAPQRLKRDVLGVQWCSSIFPERAPEGYVLWRALCGGVQRQEMVDWDDDRLAKAVYEELKLAQGVRGEPVFRHIVRWPRAIPQYLIGHSERVERIEARNAKYPNLHLTGNAFKGVAMNDCVEQGDRIAMAIEQSAKGGAGNASG
jgi:protoporphyrinogen/coproporphyrinogen III oxidase